MCRRYTIQTHTNVYFRVYYKLNTPTEYKCTLSKRIIYKQCTLNYVAYVSTCQKPQEAQLLEIIFIHVFTKCLHALHLKDWKQRQGGEKSSETFKNWNSCHLKISYCVVIEAFQMHSLSKLMPAHCDGAEWRHNAAQVRIRATVEPGCVLEPDRTYLAFHWTPIHSQG